jgi:hypothetical protein
MRLTGKVALLTGATGDFGRAIVRLLAGRRSWSSHDLQAWHVLSPLRGRYLAWSLASMRPSGLVMVLNDVCVNERRRVLECGAGVSTLYLARLLHERGGNLVTLEHDERWSEYVSRQLKDEGLDSCAQVLHASLEAYPSLAGRRWYARGAVDRAVSALGDVGLLVVDGPPAFETRDGMTRYPALPMLLDALADDCTVVLDNIERRGERRVIGRWEAETPIRFEYRIDPGGIAIGRRPGYRVIGV